MTALVDDPPARRGLCDQELGSRDAAFTVGDPDMLSGTSSRTRHFSLRGPYVEISIDVDLPEPKWFRPVLERMTHLLELREDWDSYGGLRIHPKAVARSLLLLDSSMSERVPAPSVVPSPDGGVQLEWHRRGLDVEIEISPSERIALYTEGFGEQAPELEGDTDEVAPAVARVLRALADPE